MAVLTVLTKHLLWPHLVNDDNVGWWERAYAIILVGYAVMYHLDQKLEIRVAFTGKAATAAQMVAVAWIMLQLPHYLVSVYVAGFFTLASGAIYVSRGIRQLRSHEQTH